MDDEPLDFEKEDLLLSTPRPATKRRKVIGLDELLADYYVEKSKLVQKESKKSTKSKGSISDDEDENNQKTKKILEAVEQCQQVTEINNEDEIPLWGLRVFGRQKPPPSLSNTGIGNCELLQAFSGNELNSVLNLHIEQGESFLEGLLMNGWLSKLARTRGFVEDSVASWTFYQMLYSLKEEVEVLACAFWCDILLYRNEADQPLVRVDWLPNYSTLKDALEAYGYLFDAVDNDPSISKVVHADFEYEGPPRNIVSWIKVLSACCQIRSHQSIFSTSEAEEFLGVVICLFLDRQLQGLSSILNDCLQSVISFFNESEWDVSSKKVAEYVAYRTPKDLNCLRVVECIVGVDSRSKHVRSQLALQILIICFHKKVSSGKEIMESLMSVHVKDKECDFFKLYVYLVLAENLLLSYHPKEERSVFIEMWCKYLRHCSSQIMSTDWRSYASKVRNKASYLLHNITQGRNCE